MLIYQPKSGRAYTLYQLLLNQVDPEREIYLAITDIIYEEIFSEPIGQLVISELPMKLLVIDSNKVEVKQWIPPRIMQEL
ncbi:element excision factor XisH family protein [Nostoc sp. FACHB-280]|uniref:element excision factor XisH family protein n=1 Tax=Nostoc sp. FACHB-280 TaxID=2692839 RepID=UPI0028C3ACB2|nr:element excision factor XisH family protein [Nostoc sp. FACHB-280]